MAILITNYCKIITNYDKKLLQITVVLLQITAALIFWKIQNYYKLRQVLLHITAVSSVITNYKLRQILQITTLLQITS